MRTSDLKWKFVKRESLPGLKKLREKWSLNQGIGTGLGFKLKKKNGRPDELI